MTFPLINDWQQKSWENSLHSHCVPSFLKLIFTTASSPDVSTRDFPGKRQHPGQVTEKKEELLLFSADLPSGQLNWFVSLSLYRFPRHNIKYFSIFTKTKSMNCRLETEKSITDSWKLLTTLRAANCARQIILFFSGESQRTAVG